MLLQTAETMDHVSSHVRVCSFEMLFLVLLFLNTRYNQLVIYIERFFFFFGSVQKAYKMSCVCQK